jgi:nucleotide-binding universal stress UspA family protein
MWTCPPARIVVGVDFGDASLRALETAARLARLTGATLIAAHAEALEAPPYFTAGQIARIERGQALARRRATGYLREFARRATGLEVAADVRPGSPAEVLLQVAAEADLLVLGTHGRRGPARWWLGSVAERVVRTASVPVLVVHDRPVDATFARPLLLDRAVPGRAATCAAALAALDGGRVTTVPAADAAAEARIRGASVLVVPRDPGAQAPVPADGTALVSACRLPLLFVPEEIQP